MKRMHYSLRPHARSPLPVTFDSYGIFLLRTGLDWSMRAKCAKSQVSPYVVTEELVEPGKPKRTHSVRLTKETVPLHLENATVEADHGNGQDDGPATLITQKNFMLPPIRRMLEWFHFLWSVQASPKGSNSV